MNLLIKNGRVIDAASGRDEVADVAVAAGRIVSIGALRGEFTPQRVIDATGLVVAPGLVDLAARLRELAPQGAFAQARPALVVCKQCAHHGIQAVERRIGRA